MGLYVILEWNQASGNPTVGELGSVYYEREEALEVLAWARAEKAKTPRRERYSLARLTVVAEEDEGWSLSEHQQEAQESEARMDRKHEEKT